MSRSFPADADSSPNRSDLLAWGTVRSALVLTFFGGLLFFLCSLLLGVVFLTHPAEVRKVPLLILVVIVLSLFGVLAGLVLILTGVCMTMAAPVESGARIWSLLATVCAFVFLLVCVVLALAGFDSHARKIREERGVVFIDELKPPEKPPFSDREMAIMGLLAQAALGVGIVCHLLSLRAMAAAFRRTGLALSIVAYLLFVLLAFAGLNVVVFNQVKQQGPRSIEEVETTAQMVLGGVVLLGLWGLIATGLVRGSITQGMLRPEGGD